MQYLVKYCKKEHNIQLDCKTIQIGSLNYYREMDPQFSIADHNEGRETTLIGNYNSEKAKPEIKQHLNHGDGNVRIYNSVFEHRFPNSLIFCLSLDTGKDYIENAQALEYDSWYIVTNVNIFGLKLINIIMEGFKVSWFDSSVRPQLEQFSVFDFKQIQLVWQFQDVKYVDTKNPIIVDSKLTHGSIEGELIDRLVFSKEKKFKEDKEFRLLFRFQHPRIGDIPVRDEPIVLPISPLASELLPLS